MSSLRRAHFYRKIVASKLYIDKYYDSAIDVSNIASEAGFSKYDFIRQFRRTYGTTPYQYLTKVRLQEAAVLLRSDNLTVLQVCTQIGFSSASSFSSLFRRKFGESPRSYQLSYAGRCKKLAVEPRSFVPCCFRTNMVKVG